MGRLAMSLTTAITYLTNFFQEDREFDPSVRAMEEAIVSEICAVGGDLLSRLATWYVGAIPRPTPIFGMLMTCVVRTHSVKRHLTPHAGRFTKTILFHMEQSLPP